MHNAETAAAPPDRPTDVTLVVDGGDRACGELLLVLAAEIRSLPARSVVRLVATDPAAVVDLPAWCHLTGHRFLGAGLQPDDRAHYDVRVTASARPTQSVSPWRLDNDPAPPTGNVRKDTAP